MSDEYAELDDFTPNAADGPSSDIETVEGPEPDQLDVIEDPQVWGRDGQGGHDSIDAYIGEEYTADAEFDRFATPKLGASANTMIPTRDEEQQV